VVLVAALAAAAVLSLTGLGAGLLFVTPALLVLGVLAAGWFPGEDALVAAIDRRRRRPLRAPAAVVPRRSTRVLTYTLDPVSGLCAGRAPPLSA
jgi:hypothetical protein